MLLETLPLFYSERYPKKQRYYPRKGEDIILGKRKIVS
jgi:hypothetical protein